MHNPVIGITSDWTQKTASSIYPWYQVRQNYIDAVCAHGAIPLILPYHLEGIERYVEILDGLLITGGRFDVDPKHYGQAITSTAVCTMELRTQFELELAKAFMRSHKPILGICGGHQLLNVMSGGSLIQHIPDSVHDALPHQQQNPRHEVSHQINIAHGSQLHQIVECDHYWVNSSHHQAIDMVGEGFIVNARSCDNIIEGIEKTDHPFCIGIQWHPEFFITEKDKGLFANFIRACRQ